MTRWITPVLLLLLAVPALAADPLPATTPHGVLIDRVAPLARLQEIDGSATTPVVGLPRWRQAVFELERSAQAPLGWPAPRDLQQSALATAPRAEVPLALVHARYDRLDEAGQVAAGEILALGALREQIHQGASTVYRLAGDRILSHGTGPLTALTLDVDDGDGPRPLTPDQEIPVRYASTGRKTLTLTARTADGRILTAKSFVEVRLLAVPDPTATWSITASEPYQGVAASGQAYLYLAPGRTQLSNPVLVVEGFDLDNTMDWPVLYDLLNRENLLEDLRMGGYDAVVLDFTEATEPIQRNAMVLTELIGQVRAVIPANRSIAVVGASMGGLVARYGLLWMEEQQVDPGVRLYVSFDSPHGGANIPLGLQHWLDFFQGESTDAAFLLSRLDTGAAKQMLLYHHGQTGGGSSGPDPLRAAWLADLAALGDWPVTARRVAVTNGSADGWSQGFAAGAQIISYEYTSLLVDITGNVWAVSDSPTPTMIFDGGINLIWPLEDTYETVSVGGLTAWDHAPGGWRGSMAQMDQTAAPYGDIVAVHDNHCFIPSVSALALTGVGPFHDIAGDPDLLSRTAFDAVYYPVADPANQEHIAITPENKQWMIGEIEAGVSAAPEPRLAAAAARLLPAAPNPFNPRTTLRWSQPGTGAVDLAVYDLRGRRVRQLVQEVRPAGEHRVEWAGVDDRGQGLPSGVYFVRLATGKSVASQRTVLLK